MIYTASHFARNCHHGIRTSVSLKDPPDHPADVRLEFFNPLPTMINGMDRKQYLGLWWGLMEQRRPQVEAWLASLDPAENITLLDWEDSQSPYANRNLVLAIARKHRPDCVGGSDIECKPTRGHQK